MFTIKKVDNKVVIKRVASIFTLSVFSLGMFYVLFSPVIIATTQAVASNSVPGSLFSFFSPFVSFQNAMAATTGTTVVSVVVSKELMKLLPQTLLLQGPLEV